MNIIDYSKKFDAPISTLEKHTDFFPKNIFCIIAGSTGSGKTNLLVNLLLQKDAINYSDLYVYSTTLHQPAYEYLKKCFETFEKLIYNKTHKTVKLAHFNDKDSELVDPSTLPKEQNHVMVFDDVMMEDQSMIKKYFCSGRHNNVNIFYLVQSLHKIAKHCIRENANIFILFRQDDKTLKYFHETHISADMDFPEFKKFCDGAFTAKHGFIVVNIWDDPYSGRYWENYNKIYIPKKYA